MGRKHLAVDLAFAGNGKHKALFVISGEAVSAVPEARLAAGTQLFLFRGDEYRIENRGEQAVRLFCLSADDAQN